MNTDNNLSILAVDDDPLNLEILATSLTREGHMVDCVTNGGDALLALNDRPSRYDLVLLDKMMPVMDGDECLSRIKKCGSLAGIPVIMQTASIGEEDIQSSLELGAASYITKPFTKKDLVAAIESVLNARVKEADVIVTRKKPNETYGSINLKLKTISKALQVKHSIVEYFGLSESKEGAIGELLVDAIQYGNVGLTKAEREILLEQGKWEEEINDRARSSERRHRSVSINLIRTNRYDEISVTHEGRKFNWRDYTETESPKYFTKFDDIEFDASGKTIRCKMYKF